MSVYHQRRQALMKQLEQDSIVLLPAGKEVLRNNDVHYRFRQNSDFYYLTGYHEPDAVLVLLPEKNQFGLFNLAKNPLEERWTGIRVGLERAKQEYGADFAYPIDDLNKRLPELMSGKRIIYSCYGVDRQWDDRLHGWVKALQQQVRKGFAAPNQFIKIEQFLHEMRLKKSPEELALMQKAASISAHAHKRAMQVCRPDMYEYQLEAVLQQEFYHAGCRRSAYDAIVASGERACILHYTENQQPMRDGECVLIDAGAEYQHYAADITRTFPVNGRFTGPQKELYQLVLNAQLAGIDVIKPGAPWMAVQEKVVEVLTQGLIDLGILSGSLAQLLEEKAYLPFYMHQSGHWLGMDVHDVGVYKQAGQWREFAPGHVLTVEPGLYIDADCQSVAEHWRGIGIRIEDDVAVTASGCDILSSDVPKTIDAIEALMAG